MKDMVRSIDNLGRIVLPKEIRTQNGLAEGDGLIIKVTNDGILLIPLKAHCLVCGSTKNIMPDDVAICRPCTALIYNRLGTVE